MEFGDVIRKRRMVRAFSSEPLGQGVAHRLLTAANRAPSAGFSQGYALLVLDEPGVTRHGGRCRTGTSTPGSWRC